jgi:hypothetical protein
MKTRGLHNFDAVQLFSVNLQCRVKYFFHIFVKAADLYIVECARQPNMLIHLGSKNNSRQVGDPWSFI